MHDTLIAPELPTVPAANGDLTQPGRSLALAEAPRPEASRARQQPARGQDHRAPTGIQRILAPTDFSPASTRAVERAAAIASQCNAALTILHIVDINAQAAPGESGIAEDLMKRLWGEGSAEMGKLAGSLSGRVDAQITIEQGLPWEAIAEKSSDFDLVVLGQGRSGFRKGFFSQHTARRVIENAACPVMVVPDLD